MSFHLSAEDIRVEDRHILKANLRNVEGELIEAELDLNTVIGNNEGQFEWGGEGFVNSANPDEEIAFSLEGDDSVPILRACLADSSGEWHWHDINLAERIGNNDGSFHFGKFERSTSKFSKIHLLTTWGRLLNRVKPRG